MGQKAHPSSFFLLSSSLLRTLFSCGTQPCSRKKRKHERLVSFPSDIQTHVANLNTAFLFARGRECGRGRGLKLNDFDTHFLSLLWRSFGVNSNSPPLSGVGGVLSALNKAFWAVGVNFHFTDSCPSFVFFFCMEQFRHLPAVPEQELH